MDLRSFYFHVTICAKVSAVFLEMLQIKVFPQTNNCSPKNAYLLKIKEIFYVFEYFTDIISKHTAGVMYFLHDLNLHDSI